MMELLQILFEMDKKSLKRKFKGHFLEIESKNILIVRECPSLKAGTGDLLIQFDNTDKCALIVERFFLNGKESHKNEVLSKIRLILNSSHCKEEVQVNQDYIDVISYKENFHVEKDITTYFVSS